MDDFSPGFSGYQIYPCCSTKMRCHLLIQLSLLDHVLLRYLSFLSSFLSFNFSHLFVFGSFFAINLLYQSIDLFQFFEIFLEKFLLFASKALCCENYFFCLLLYHQVCLIAIVFFQQTLT